VVDAASGKVTLLSHHTILECGNMLVPELVSGQIQGATATGIGLALHEWLPLYPVAAALEKHICRCTGYVRYYQAVRDVILATPGLTRDGA
jgi:hypothetical protein